MNRVNLLFVAAALIWAVHTYAADRPFDGAQDRPFDGVIDGGHDGDFDGDRPFEDDMDRPFDDAQGRPFDGEHGRPFDRGHGPRPGFSPFRFFASVAHAHSPRQAVRRIARFVHHAEHQGLEVLRCDDDAAGWGVASVESEDDLWTEDPELFVYDECVPGTVLVIAPEGFVEIQVGDHFLYLAASREGECQADFLEMHLAFGLCDVPGFEGGPVDEEFIDGEPIDEFEDEPVDEDVDEDGEFFDDEEGEWDEGEDVEWDEDELDDLLDELGYDSIDDLLADLEIDG